jgi:hypothetical protein
MRSLYINFAIPLRMIRIRQVLLDQRSELEEGVGKTRIIGREFLPFLNELVYHSQLERRD